MVTAKEGAGQVAARCEVARIGRIMEGRTQEYKEGKKIDNNKREPERRE